MKKILISAVALTLGLAATARLNSSKRDVTQSLDVFNALVKELQLSYVDSIDIKKSVDTAILYMLDEIDPYTEYYSADDTEDLERLSTGEYGGIGCVIAKDKRGRIIASEPYQGTPSYKSGLRVGDVFVAIDGDSLTSEWTIEKTSSRLKGTPGTHVTVTVNRPFAADSILTFDIERAKIAMPVVSWFGTTGPDNKVGYIQLTSFTDKAPAEVRDAVEELMKQRKITSLILDLQGNPGGLLESAVQIVGLFVPKGTEVVRTRGRDALSEKIYRTTHQPIAPNLPLAVVIDGASASSAEIVAGALQDLDRAVIVGERSFGKGLVQSSRTLPYDGALKLTVAKYYIPSGRLIQAIDYSRRNEDGSVARTPDSLTTAYSTLHGREVRDGGGITPDRAVKQPNMNRLLYNIRRDSWDFDFATAYAATHTLLPSPGEFVVTDTLFSEFKASIDPGQFHYDRACESLLKTLREAVDTEGYMSPEVEEQLNVLETMLHHNLEQDLDVNRPILERMVSDAIVRRYYGQSGAVENALRYDTAVAEAVKILSDTAEYNRILGK